MSDRLRFLYNRISERLWVKPLLMCLFSIAAALFARGADGLDVPVLNVSRDSIETLLSIVASSMLVIASLAVSSMVSAYASASNSATPRSFSLVVSDDKSQYALSTFLGAFIFSIIGLIALKTEYYGESGRFVLFVFTLVMFSAVILTFVRWVDQIARLGRTGATIDKVEAATLTAIKRRRAAPTLRGAALQASRVHEGIEIFSERIGYVQRVDIGMLQAFAKENTGKISVFALPGTFTAPGRPLASIRFDSGEKQEIDSSKAEKAFIIGAERKFDEDPRFGLVVLSEIASRALSPAVNDPGTAISILASFVRLFTEWQRPDEKSEESIGSFELVEVPKLSLADMFDDAFTSIGRDGAALIEVGIRLQKSLRALASLGDEEMKEAAVLHARAALHRAENTMTLSNDVEHLREVAKDLLGKTSRIAPPEQ